MGSSDGATRKRSVRAVVIFCAALLHPAAGFASVQFDDLARFAGVDEATESHGASWGDLNGDGRIDSSTGFASWAGDGLEPSDTLQLSSSTRLVFRLGVVAPGTDGLKFISNVNANTCFTLDLPAGADIVVGANRTRRGRSFSLATLGAC